MPGKRKVGNLLALAVLSLLSQQPMHPYELGRNLREHGDDRSIKFNHGSLYMVVGQLARAGFITEQETSRGGQRPERTVYALTDAGRQELRDWLRELVEQPQHEYPAFVSALSLIAALPPSDALGLLRARLSHLEQQRAETASTVSRFAGVATDLRVQGAVTCSSSTVSRFAGVATDVLLMGGDLKRPAFPEARLRRLRPDAPA